MIEQARMCGNVYVRPSEFVEDDQHVVYCTFIAEPDHTCSWHDLKLWDTRALELMTVPDIKPDHILALVNAGRLDTYIESILAACHGRKRQLRGVYAPHGLRRTS